MLWGVQLAWPFSSTYLYIDSARVIHYSVQVSQSFWSVSSVSVCTNLMITCWYPRNFTTGRRQKLSAQKLMQLEQIYTCLK